jgi:hypothetical protein
MGEVFERVYTVYDDYDGPRAGFADFGGAPHAYRSIWRDELDDWDPDGRFVLHPVTRAVLELAIEGRAIWRRWEQAYYGGRTTDTTHPALPDDRARHDELAPVIEQALEIGPDWMIMVIGEFRAKNGARGGPGIPTSRAELEVRWIPVT